MLTFKQIEALYWIVQLGGFSNAAARLNTTQSAITKRIQELEANFDTQILNRSGHKTMLTRKGEEVFKHAATLLRQRDQMLVTLKGFNTFSGTLRLGITEITAMTWLPTLIQQLRVEFPGLLVQPTIGMAWQLQDSLLHGQLDMVVLHSELHSPELVIEPLDRIDFAWVGSPDTVSPDKLYTPGDIAAMNIIRQDQKSGLNTIYDKWLSPHKCESNLFTINSLLAMVGMTIAGFGVSCVPIDYFADLIRRRRLVALRTTKPIPSSQYNIMYQRQTNEMLYTEIVRIARGACNFGMPYGDAFNA